MKKLYLITSGYPYKHSEKPFLLTELGVLKEHFDITIFTRAHGETDPELPKEIKAVSLGEKTGKLRAALYCLKAFFTPAFHKELSLIRKSRTNVKEKRKICLVHYIIAAQFNDQLRREFKRLGAPDIVYSYWGSAALTGMAIFRRKREKWRLIGRCHGYDLFRERAQYGYQPFKQQVDAKSDGIFLVSQSCCDYYRENWSISDPAVCHISRIGSSNTTGVQPYVPSDTLRLISCSNLIPLKRIDMIIEALSLTEGLKIDWVHYGEGELEESLKKLAEEKLASKEGVICHFAGYVDNTKLKEIYSQSTFDAFLTTSEAEGLPVSVMEAISFGIPVIATNAGGMSEMVASDNGTLIPVDTNAAQVCSALTAFAALDEDERLALRECSRKKWEEDFCAEENAAAFAAAITDIDRRTD